MKILAFETSCDDTSIALFEDNLVTLTSHKPALYITYINPSTYDTNNKHKITSPILCNSPSITKKSTANLTPPPKTKNAKPNMHTNPANQLELFLTNSIRP